jgi:hypothetical protein
MVVGAAVVAASVDVTVAATGTVLGGVGSSDPPDALPIAKAARTIRPPATAAAT